MINAMLFVVAALMAALAIEIESPETMDAIIDALKGGEKDDL